MVSSVFKSVSNFGKLNFSLAPSTISTPSMSLISFGFNCAKQPVTTINASGEFFFAFLIILLHSLLAFSVTEQVLITYKSAFFSNSVLVKPILTNCLPMVEVSEKLSLQPNV